VGHLAPLVTIQLSHYPEKIKSLVTLQRDAKRSYDAEESQLKSPMELKKFGNCGFFNLYG
jgi:hypothetical protein